MTADDRELDPALFGGRELTLYRLAKAEYANLSGVGAARDGGRWNRKGQEAIYTSAEIGIPVLERLVHTPKATIPKNLALMHICLKGDWEVGKGGMFQVSDLATVAWYTTLARAKAELPGDVADIPNLIAVAVPSVIVPAWNVILFPQQKLFWRHISLTSVEPFEFDPRLFPETAL